MQKPSKSFLRFSVQGFELSYSHSLGICCSYDDHNESVDSMHSIIARSLSFTSQPLLESFNVKASCHKHKDLFYTVLLRNGKAPHSLRAVAFAWTPVSLGLAGACSFHAVGEKKG